MARSYINRAASIWPQTRMRVLLLLLLLSHGCGAARFVVTFPNATARASAVATGVVKAYGRRLVLSEDSTLDDMQERWAPLDVEADTAVTSSISDTTVPFSTPTDATVAATAADSTKAATEPDTTVPIDNATEAAIEPSSTATVPFDNTTEGATEPFDNATEPPTDATMAAMENNTTVDNTTEPAAAPTARDRLVDVGALAESNVTAAEAASLLQAEGQWPLQPDEDYGLHLIRGPLATRATIAVLDGGLPPVALPLFRHIEPGYDFISDPLYALDGDGRDADWLDLGDAAEECPVSSWHGLQVTSVLASAPAYFVDAFATAATVASVAATTPPPTPDTTSLATAAVDTTAAESGVDTTALATESSVETTATAAESGVVTTALATESSVETTAAAAESGVETTASAVETTAAATATESGAASAVETTPPPTESATESATEPPPTESATESATEPETTPAPMEAPIEGRRAGLWSWLSRALPSRRLLSDPSDENSTVASESSAETSAAPVETTASAETTAETTAVSAETTADTTTAPAETTTETTTVSAETTADTTTAPAETTTEATTTPGESTTAPADSTVLAESTTAVLTESPTDLQTSTETTTAEGQTQQETTTAPAVWADYEGVCPSCRIVPIRVLGRCKTGYASDVADAIVWASGGRIDSVADSTTPAKVISMSFTGLGACPSYLQSAVNQVSNSYTTRIPVVSYRKTTALTPLQAGAPQRRHPHRRLRQRGGQLGRLLSRQLRRRHGGCGLYAARLLGSLLKPRRKHCSRGARRRRHGSHPRADY